MPEIVPSILSANFTRLREDIEAVEQAGAKRLHLDVMDGHFVPNITFGPMIVSAIRKMTKMHLETHLMIENPDKYIKQFADAGSDTILIQWEATMEPERDLAMIKRAGCKVGLVINPATTYIEIKKYVRDIDHLLVMTVEPGFGGQSMIKSALNKVEIAKGDSEEHRFLIQIDGGVRISTVYEAVGYGPDLLVAGSAIFGHRDPGQAFRELTGLLY